MSTPLLATASVSCEKTVPAAWSNPCNCACACWSVSSSVRPATCRPRQQLRAKAARSSLAICVCRYATACWGPRLVTAAVLLLYSCLCSAAAIDTLNRLPLQVQLPSETALDLRRCSAVRTSADTVFQEDSQERCGSILSFTSSNGQKLE